MKYIVSYFGSRLQRWVVLPQPFETADDAWEGAQEIYQELINDNAYVTFKIEKQHK